VSQPFSPKSFSINKDAARPTLAAAIKRHIDSLSWERARRLCERGKVTVDGKQVLDPARRLRPGQTVVVDERAPAPEPVIKVTIVYEDAHVVVIDKPAGVSSVPYEKRDTGTAMDLLRDAWRRGGHKASSTALHVVHRIDKETSGLLAFAKTKLAERTFQALFRAHDVERTYLCVVHGHLSDRRIETRLVEDRGDGLRGSTRRLGQGKRAVTHVRVKEELPRASLCEVRLETGKTHQIRIHLAEGGHPLVGEKVYIRDFGKKGLEPIACPRLLLHAATLGFTHPLTKRKVRLESKLPEDFTRPLSQLRKK
jgi:23S rRNA pseudouridine1911/1915/1917 synthase